MQRIGGWRRNLDFGENSAVKQRAKAVARCDCHVVIARRADVEVVRQFSVKQHCAAFVTFGPQVLWHFAAREDGIDARADVVRNPVHGTLK